MSSQAVEVQPRYPESDARSWLSWMARNMSRRGQTVLLIEAIQPGWLTSLPQVLLYVLVSRLACVLPLGLALSCLVGGLLLLDPSSFDAIDFLSGALVLSLICVVPVIAVDVARLVRGSSRVRIHGSGRRIAWAGTLAVLVVLSFWACTRLPLGFLRGLWSLESAIVVGLTAGWFVSPRNLENDIQPVETTTWSWLRSLGGVWKGGLLGLGFSTPIPFLTLLREYIERSRLHVESSSISWSPWPFVILLLILFVGVGALLGALVGGRTISVSAMKVVPNEGIRRSARNAIRLGGLAIVPGLCLLFVLINVILLWDERYYTDFSFGWGIKDWGLWLPSLFVMSVGIALLYALYFGGLDVIRHSALRVVLRCFSLAPLDLARFLDYSANTLNLLQKVGGGYIFIHRFLLEHFAETSESEVLEEATTLRGRLGGNLQPSG